MQLSLPKCFYDIVFSLCFGGRIYAALCNLLVGGHPFVRWIGDPEPVRSGMHVPWAESSLQGPACMPKKRQMLELDKES